MKRFIAILSATAVLAGERSTEECAELIQSRVSIYLSENS